jgi:probable O-glycosylation ligase (exosortase A-associated)
MPIRGLLLLGFVLVSAPICLFRPFYGIVLWVVFAFLNPQAYAWTAYNQFSWALIVAIPTLVGTFIFDRRFKRLASVHVAFLLILWAWFTITTLVTTEQPEFKHHAFETWERWNFVSKILVMTVCTVMVVHSFERLRLLVLTIAGCFGFYVLKALPFVIMTGGAYRLYGPDRSMIGDNTDFGLALNMTLPMYFYLAQSEQRRWFRWVLWFFFLITIPAIFFTYSRGALLGLIAVFGVMLLQSRRRLSLVPVAVLGLVIAFMFTPETWQGRMDLTSENALDNSAQSRLDSWAYARALAADYPVTGGGFGTFTEELYTRYWSAGHPGTVLGPHSVYFQVLAEHGYVGLALYLSLVLSCLVSTWRLGRTARKNQDDAIALYAPMFQVSLVGFLISGIFLGRAYFDYFFTIVACIAVLRHIATARWAATQPAAIPVLQPADAARVSSFGFPGAQLPTPPRR